jgi:hypothetical protein
MAIRLKALCLAACAASIFAAAANAQGAPPLIGGEHSGRAILTSKCFQCHRDSMWRDQRQDRRAWEATLYRMVGRGALWTSDEVAAMADYLATDYGPNAKPTPAK